MAETFSEGEREAMREARIALFEDRLILEAQPPVDDVTLARIAKKCAGPLPEDLIALWRTSFGGTLGYDLRASFKDQEASLSFTELFFPGSDGYRDLWGWIEHEEELAQESAEEQGKSWAGVLDAVPFGGFDYAERLYAIVSPGRDHGAVLAWMQGLPPAWIFRLHEDSVASLCDSVRALFRMLVLEVDPETGGEEGSGRHMLEAIDHLASSGGEGRGAAEKLRGLVRGTVLDWRAALADGSLLSNRALRRLCLEHAACKDDLEILGRLAWMRCDFSEALRGGGNGLDYALASGALRAARFFLDRGVPATGSLRAGARNADVELAQELLRRGAEVDANAIFAAVDAGRLETAFVLLDALGRAAAKRLAPFARRRADDEEQSAQRLEARTLQSNVPAAEYRSRAVRFRQLADRADSM